MVNLTRKQLHFLNSYIIIVINDSDIFFNEEKIMLRLFFSLGVVH